MSSKNSPDILFLSGWSVSEAFVSTCLPVEAACLNVCVLSYAPSSDNVEQAVHEFLERAAQLVGSNTVVIGWSLGGLLAVKLVSALEAEGLPYSRLVVLMAGVSFLQRSDRLFGKHQNEFDQFRDLAADDDKLLRHFPYLLVKGCDDERNLLRSVRRAYLQNFQEKQTRLRALEALRELDVGQELEELKKPALVVCGDQDALFDRQMFSKAFPPYAKHELLGLQNQGHFPFTERVYSAVREFLSASNSVLECK